jgi:hypothetical protein
MLKNRRDRPRPEPNETIQDQIRSIEMESQGYLEYLDALARPDHQTEQLAPKPLDQFQQDILLFHDDEQFPAPSPSPGELTYITIYETVTSRHRPSDRHPVLTALFAAEIENHSRRDLTTNQVSELANAFERIGNALLRIELPQHAAFAFERARRAYLKVNDLDARSRCLYGLAQAERRTSQKLTWKWLRCTVLWALAGYGFRPWRLLSWIIVQFLVLATIHTIVANRPFVTSCYAIVVNYIDLSVDDRLTSGGVILIIDGYTGVLTTSVFFALLIKHWFR